MILKKLGNNKRVVYSITTLYSSLKYSTIKVIKYLGVTVSGLNFNEKTEQRLSIDRDRFNVSIEVLILHLTVFGLILYSFATSEYKSFILFNK